jgi:hypothetical protein
MLDCVVDIPSNDVVSFGLEVKQPGAQKCQACDPSSLFGNASRLDKPWR